MAGIDHRPASPVLANQEPESQGRTKGMATDNRAIHEPGSRDQLRVSQEMGAVEEAAAGLKPPDALMWGRVRLQPAYPEILLQCVKNTLLGDKIFHVKKRVIGNHFHDHFPGLHD